MVVHDRTDTGLQWRASAPSLGAQRSSADPVDDEDDLDTDGESGFLFDDDEWPPHFGAARLGIP